MAETSQGSTVVWGDATASEVRSVTVSGDGVNLIDISVLGENQSLQMTGTGMNPTITVVTLDTTLPTTPTASGNNTADTLTVTYGTNSVTYYNAALVDYSPSAAVDAAVEHTYTFTCLDNS